MVEDVKKIPPNREMHKSIESLKADLAKVRTWSRAHVGILGSRAGRLLR